MAKKRDLKAFAVAVFAADFNSCMAPYCPCHGFSGRRLDPCHIKARSLGGADTVENGVTLCREIHEKTHNGYTDKRTGKRITGAELMISILEHWRGTSFFRWEEAIEWLKTCSAHKGPSK